MNKIDLKTFKVPGFSNYAVIEVYYLEAVLGLLQKVENELDMKNRLFQPNAFHSAVGFRVKTGSNIDTEFVFDLSVESFNLSIFLPIIKDGELEWFNRTVYSVYPIDRNYWYKSTYICNINRHILIRLVDWLQGGYIQTNSMYVFLSIFSCSPNIDGKCLIDNPESPIIKGYICDDFCYDVFRYLQNIQKIDINYIVVPDYTVTGILVDKNSIINDITILDYNNPIDKQFIIGYYSNLYDLSNSFLNDLKARRNPFSPNSNFYKYLSEIISIDKLIKMKSDVDKMFLLEISNRKKFLDEVINALEGIPSKDPTVDNVKNDLLNILHTIIFSKTSGIIHYSYTKGTTLDTNREKRYYLIKNPKGLYFNYISLSFYKDYPSKYIDGNLVYDKFTKKDSNNRLIIGKDPCKIILLIIILFLLLFLLIVILYFIRKK